MPQHDDERNNVQRIPNRPRDLTDVSRAVLRSEQAKRWTKKYRTEVAASSSSLLSTFVAVRYYSRREYMGELLIGLVSSRLGQDKVAGV